jgi:hypothetical protein
MLQQNYVESFTTCFHVTPPYCYQELTSDEKNGEGSAEGQCRYVGTECAWLSQLLISLQGFDFHVEVSLP